MKFYLSLILNTSYWYRIHFHNVPCNLSLFGLSQTSPLIAGTLGLFVAVYISFSEFYLQDMNGELQPVLSS